MSMSSEKKCRIILAFYYRSERHLKFNQNRYLTKFGLSVIFLGITLMTYSQLTVVKSFAMGVNAKATAASVKLEKKPKVTSEAKRERQPASFPTKVKISSVAKGD